jgi:hypothetical protein
MTQGFPIGYSYSYTHITTNTTTSIKTGAGILNSVVINNPGATWTVTINDGGNTIGVISPTSSMNTLIYETSFNSGLSIVTAGTTPGDITVTWQ